MRQSVGQTPAMMISSSVQKLKTRMGEKGHEGKDMLQKFIQAHHDNPMLVDPAAIIGLLVSTVSGAGDTTATTITALLFYLVKDPERLAKLREELQHAGLSKDHIPLYRQTAKLPYLAAVIKETMRLFPVLNTPMERRIPSGGATIAGHLLPAGASVGIFTPALHLDKAVFGQDAAHFRPERWIDPNAEGVRRMEQAGMGFRRGRRVCLGQNVALMQMKKVVPALILGFDFRFVHEDACLTADMKPMVLVLNPLWMTATESVSAHWLQT